jgi:hypothetical protein
LSNSIIVFTAPFVVRRRRFTAADRMLGLVLRASARASWAGSPKAPDPARFQRSPLSFASLGHAGACSVAHPAAVQHAGGEAGMRTRRRTQKL